MTPEPIKLEESMARKWQVHLVKSGRNKDVQVVAVTQSEAKKTAEAQNPGYRAVSSRDLGSA